MTLSLGGTETNYSITLNYGKVLEYITNFKVLEQYLRVLEHERTDSWTHRRADTQTNICHNFY